MKQIISAILTILMVLTICCVPETLASRALSLRALQEAARTCQNSYGCTQEELYMHGITRFTGYLVDRENNDIIMLGEVSYTSPPLLLEDFVVALRNSWMRYARGENGVTRYTNPVCSIDPSPDVVSRLNGFDLASLKDAAGQASWEQLCGSLQEVNVWGIPFDSHFAHIMVMADYDMKRLVDGSDVLEIPGFSSLTEITLQQVRRDISAGKPISVSLRMNRFWFAPGRNIYLENDDIVTIQECQVKLMTEEQYFSSFGAKEATGGSDPYADSFSKAFTEHYHEIAQQRSVNLELENLFRFVALAKILRYRQAFESAKLDPGFFLNEFELETTTVERHLPGRSALRNYQQQEEIDGGIRTHRLWLPSCGGVGIEIHVSNLNFLQDSTGILRQLRTSVLDVKPLVRSTTWDYSNE